MFSWREHKIVFLNHVRFQVYQANASFIDVGYSQKYEKYMNVIQKQLTCSENCILCYFRKNKFRELFVRIQFHKTVCQIWSPLYQVLIFNRWSVLHMKHMAVISMYININKCSSSVTILRPKFVFIVTLITDKSCRFESSTTLFPANWPVCFLSPCTCEPNRNRPTLLQSWHWKQ
jgi:hypothetical protein